MLDVICLSDSRDSSDSMRGIVGLRIGDVFVMPFSRGMIFLIAWMYQSFVSDEEVTAGKGFGADVADEGFFFSMGADVSLEMFLQAVISIRAH
jgi:hypothetical protein